MNVEQRTRHDDEGQPIALGYLSYSGDLKIAAEVQRKAFAGKNVEVRVQIPAAADLGHYK